MVGGIRRILIACLAYNEALFLPALIFARNADATNRHLGQNIG